MKVALETVEEAQGSGAHSHLTRMGCGAREPIEPPVSFLRDPRALVLAPQLSARFFFGKEWLVLPSAEVFASVRAAGGRVVFIDLGAGMFDAGGRTPGAVNGSSLNWFSAAFKARGALFDEVIAFEARELRAKRLWASMPPELVPKLRYYNVPAHAEPGHKLHPWRILVASPLRLTPRHYVVIKLNIDHAATELALMCQLLGDEAGGEAARPIVDELFWDHHVVGSVLHCPRLWKWREPMGRGWVGSVHNKSDPQQTLAGSYELLGRLRRMGIRAHSWV